MRALFLCLFLSSCAIYGRPQPYELHSEEIVRGSDRERKVEILWVEPTTPPPWPALIYIHGHQEKSEGAKAFADWGMLRKTAEQGFFAAAVSLPGYGKSTTTRDFGGPDAQKAAFEAVEHIRARPDVLRNKTVIEGVSRGASVAARVAQAAAGLGGLILISGVYEMGEAYKLWKKSPPGSEGYKQFEAIVNELALTETGPSAVEIEERSVLPHPDIRCPLLVLHGEKDPLAPASQARELAEKVADRGVYAKAMIYPETGAYVPVETREKEIAPFLQRAFGLHILPLE